MSSEEQQIEAEANTPEADITALMDIDTALLLYKNLQYSLQGELDSLISPYAYNKQGQQTKTKSQGKRMQDLMTLSVVLKAAFRDLEPDTNQFETQKAKTLYGSILAVQKAKEVIKTDLKNKLASGDVDNVSEEQKEKLLKGL